MASPRMTIPTQRVLRALLAEDDAYGARIAEAAGLATGTVHPILARLERIEWVASRWEQVDPREAGRPARRFYRLTDSGRLAAERALARAYRPARTGVVARPVGKEW